MRRILVCVECLDYNYIMEAQPPNLLRLDAHPAVSFGLGSRPAAAALMGGMLPVCQIPECPHRQIRELWSNPFFLTSIKAQTEKQFYLCPNGWIIELLLPWMDREQREKNFYWHDHLTDWRPGTGEPLPSQEILEYFLARRPTGSYFAYLHFFETHWPHFSPQGFHDRKAAVLFTDGLLGKLLAECQDEEIVIVSDHNIPPNIVSAANDVPSPKTMLSFIACNGQALKGEAWKTEAHVLAKGYWLGK